MAGLDPNHWLHRLTADEWLVASLNELGRAESALLARQRRAGVVQARRAAGMAWNAVLAAGDGDDRYGRTYMEHIAALATDGAVPEAVRAAAAELVAAPLVAPLVTLGKGDVHLATCARIILEHARQRVAPTATT